MRVILAIAIASAGLMAASAQGQHRYDPNHDPVRLKYQDSRQYRGEPRGNAAKRNTRCKIVRQRGQDKRVCGVPTNYARPRTHR